MQSITTKRRRERRGERGRRKTIVRACRKSTPPPRSSTETRSERVDDADRAASEKMEVISSALSMKTLSNEGVLENFCTTQYPRYGINCDNSRLGAIILRVPCCLIIPTARCLYDLFRCYRLFDFFVLTSTIRATGKVNSPFN